MASAAVPLDLYIVTFNCGRELLDVDVFAASLFKEHRARQALPDLVFVALQEVAPIAHSFLGGTWLAPFFAPFVRAVNKAAGSGGDAFRHLITHNVGMTALMVFARADVADAIRWVQTGEVGVGWWEMGNKGAAAVRLGWSPDGLRGATTPLTLVAAHLAPGEERCQRRNADWENIVRRLVLRSPDRHTASLSKARAPVSGEEDETPLLGSEPDGLPTLSQGARMFGGNSAVFFAGDLNYRTGDEGPAPDASKGFPQPRDDSSDPLHYSHFLPHDQLTRERTAGRALHHMDELPIEFVPTYKLSSKQQESTSRAQYLSCQEPAVYHWATHRLPSWCDRVLFSSSLTNSKAFLATPKYEALGIQPTSDHRPVSFSAQLDLDAASASMAAQTSPFELDPAWESRRIRARRLELIVGALAYLGLTREGNALLGATLVGAVGAWFVVGSVLGR